MNLVDEIRGGEFIALVAFAAFTIVAIVATTRYWHAGERGLARMCAFIAIFVFGLGFWYLLGT